MQIRDFHVGQVFTLGRSDWRCTDIGRRTIAAVPVDPAAELQEAPPYTGERLFAEEDVAYAHLTPELAMAGDVLHYTLASEQTLDSTEIARQDRRVANLKALRPEDPDYYPRARLAGVRVDLQGQSWSAYAAHRNAAGDWQIEAFNFHAQAAQAMPEAHWLSWPFHAADPHVTVPHPESGAHGTEAALRQLIREELQRAGRDPIQADAFLQQGHAGLEGLHPLSVILGRRTAEELDSPAVHTLLALPPRQRQAEMLEKALRDWIEPLTAE